MNGADIIAIIVLLAIVVAVVVYLLHWLYRHSSKDLSFVRTGWGGEKVVMGGGAFVLPIVHDVAEVSMNTLRQREHADVSGTALLRGEAVQCLEQLRVVVRIGRVLSGVPPGAHARTAAQRVHFQAGVVGQCRQSAGTQPEPRLDRGVRLEGRAVLDRVALDPEVVERHEIRPTQVQQLAQFAQLVGGARRDQEAPVGHRRTVARAAACASNSCARPPSARSSRPLAATRSNGRPSAVPCHSI